MILPQSELITNYIISIPSPSPFVYNINTKPISICFNGVVDEWHIQTFLQMQRVHNWHASLIHKLFFLTRLIPPSPATTRDVLLKG